MEASVKKGGDKDERSFFQVVYDVFNYSPGGTDRPSHIVEVGRDKEDQPIMRQGFTWMVKRNADPDFDTKIAQVGALLLSGTLACKVITGVDVIEDDA